MKFLSTGARERKGYGIEYLAGIGTSYNILIMSG